MKRRRFFGAATGTVTAVAGFARCNTDQRKMTKKIPDSQPSTDKLMLAGKTLEELHNRYRYDLLEDYIPFLYKYVVDSEYGGFMCDTDRDGTNISTNKRAWYEGRGISVSSFLYNNIEKDPKHLEVARKSVEFILKNKPEGDSFWPHTMTREGKPLSFTSLVYGDLFVATGLQEFSRAVNDESYWNMAKDIMLKCMRLYDSPDYGKSVNGSNPQPGIGQRYLGHWMIFIRLASQMLTSRADSEVEAIVDRCLDAIMNYHFNTEYNLMNEELPHDLIRRPDENYNEASLGHGTETLWMVMFEALRRKDTQLYELAAERFKRQVEVAWDDVYGGAFMSCTLGKDDMCYGTAKSLWLQEEILIGTMRMIEETGEQWAKNWYGKMYTYVLDKYSLRQYGYPIWILYADQKVTFEEHANRVGNFHHPRHLMLNMLSIERMMNRQG